MYEACLKGNRTGPDVCAYRFFNNLALINRKDKYHVQASINPAASGTAALGQHSEASGQFIIAIDGLRTAFRWFMDSSV